ncbi:GW dipeptide domain-containing protein, partial [Ligilactobacillus salivarius]
QWTTPDGVTWINFVIDGKSVWMDANGSASPMYQRAMFIQGNRNDGLYENAPYGDSAAKYLGSVKATGNDQKSITIEMSRVLNGVLWYAGYLDGRVYWFDSAAVVNDATAPVSVNYAATVSQSNRNDGLY